MTRCSNSCAHWAADRRRPSRRCSVPPPGRHRSVDSKNSNTPAAPDTSQRRPTPSRCAIVPERLSETARTEHVRVPDERRNEETRIRRASCRDVTSLTSRCEAFDPPATGSINARGKASALGTAHFTTPPHRSNSADSRRLRGRRDITARHDDAFERTATRTYRRHVVRERWCMVRVPATRTGRCGGALRGYRYRARRKRGGPERKSAPP